MREIQKVKLILDKQITINTLNFCKLSILYPVKVSEEIRCRVLRQVRRQKGESIPEGADKSDIAYEYILHSDESQKEETETISKNEGH